MQMMVIDLLSVRALIFCMEGVVQVILCENQNRHQEAAWYACGVLETALSSCLELKGEVYCQNDSKCTVAGRRGWLKSMVCTEIASTAIFILLDCYVRATFPSQTELRPSVSLGP